jgi:hypothetical protein
MRKCVITLVICALDGFSIMNGVDYQCRRGDENHFHDGVIHGQKIGKEIQVARDKDQEKEFVRSHGEACRSKEWSDVRRLCFRMLSLRFRTLRRFRNEDPQQYNQYAQ